MNKNTNGGNGAHPFEKLAVEMGPLIVFFGVYFGGPRFMGLADDQAIFYATGAFMAAFAIAFLYQVIRFRRVAPMLLVTGAIVAIFGGLTLILKNETFIYMKPTITNLTFAAILGGGLLTSRNFLKIVFDGAFHMSDDAWRRLTLRFIGFFLVLALLNEFIWRNFSEAFWVNFKVFGVLPLTLVFVALQMPFIMKHGKEAD